MEKSLNDRFLILLINELEYFLVIFFMCEILFWYWKIFNKYQVIDILISFITNKLSWNIS